MPVLENAGVLPFSRNSTINMASKPKYILMKGWKTRLPSHCIITKTPLNACSIQCTLSERRSYTARRAGVVIRRSASFTRLELGSSLTWMLCCDYGRGGPWTWEYACWFLFGGGDWGMDVLSAYQTYVVVSKALPAHCCSVSSALVITPLSLPDLPTNSPLLKNLGCHQQKKWLTYLSQPPPLYCIASCLNYHLASLWKTWSDSYSPCSCFTVSSAGPQCQGGV